MSVLDLLRGGLVVSCQAYPGEPMRHPETMAQVAQAAAAGGAAGIRAEGLADVSLIRERVDLPLIGLWKDGPTEGVFITPTLEHALAVAAAGAQIVAVDGTRRPRPDGLGLADVVAALHDRTDALVMADCDGLASAVAARDAGADLLGTTLSGYTDARPRSDRPDLELVAEVAAAVPEVPLLAEGRMRTPSDAAAALAAGAFAVVVGTAITHPTSITGWFVDALGARPASSEAGE